MALELGPMGTKFDMYFADRTVELHILFLIFFYHSPVPHSTPRGSHIAVLVGFAVILL